MKLVRIKWRDATFHSAGWKSIKESKEYEGWIVESVGFLVKETKKEYTLAMTLDAEREETIGVFTIPKGWTTEVKELKVK